MAKQIKVDLRLCVCASSAEGSALQRERERESLKAKIAGPISAKQYPAYIAGAD